MASQAGLCGSEINFVFHAKAKSKFEKFSRRPIQKNLSIFQRNFKTGRADPAPLPTYMNRVWNFNHP